MVRACSGIVKIVAFEGRTMPVDRTDQRATLDLPWSICATMQTLRIGESWVMGRDIDGCPMAGKGVKDDQPLM
jgi:hypothetical protein